MITNFALVGSGATAQQLRSMLGLMRWLQLYMLADPAAAQPDVAVDLEGIYNGAFNKAKPAAGGVPVMHHLEVLLLNGPMLLVVPHLMQHAKQRCILLGRTDVLSVADITSHALSGSDRCRRAQTVVCTWNNQDPAAQGVGPLVWLGLPA